MASHEPLWGPREAADYLGVHIETLRKMCREGKLPFLRLPNGGYRFEPASLRFDLAVNARDTECAYAEEHAE